MKRLLTSILLFIPVLAIVYCLLIFVWGLIAPGVFKPNLTYNRGASGHLATRMQEVKKTKDVDVLILGSSHAYRGFDTRVFENQGLMAFNLGSSAQSPKQTKILLERYLDQLNPKFIIYEVYPLIFSIDGVESAIDLVSNDVNDIGSWEMALNLNNIKLYNTLIYSSMRDLVGLNNFYKEPVQQYGDTYIKGGYIEHKIERYKYKEYDDSEYNLDQTQNEAFDDVINLIQAKNVPYIMINTPINSSLYNSKKNILTFDSLMMKYGDYYDFNRLVSLDDSLHFFDHTHMNQDGVEVFSEKLMDLVREKMK